MKEQIFTEDYNELDIVCYRHNEIEFDSKQSKEIARWKSGGNSFWQGGILYLRNSIPNDYALVRIPRDPEYWLENRVTYGSILSIRGAMINCGGGEDWRRLWKETQMGARSTRP